MKKYDPLKSFLGKSINRQTNVTLSFAQIEEIISAPLPESATLHRAWWSNEQNGRHVQAHSWIEAGYIVEDVCQEEGAQAVTFRRASQS
ncbi:DUF7662 domain-containing protein [Leisingera sp. ANG-M1]|uniref:DUF7662 domain-containing protein n=1 Tax=Leisingera sp. ANG-M1 TaxID=1577895 RepID=UPI0006923CEC|nr:hypothetical protein [Leisingera sp. ANG-M1]